jgi:hypothetical protein
MCIVGMELSSSRKGELDRCAKSPGGLIFYFEVELKERAHLSKKGRLVRLISIRRRVADTFIVVAKETKT